MAIYKHGFSLATPEDRALEHALAGIRSAGDDDPVLSTGIVRTPEHEAAGEFLVRVVTGQPEPEPEPIPEREPEPVGPPRADAVLLELRYELVSRLDEIDDLLAAARLAATQPPSRET